MKSKEVRRIIVLAIALVLCGGLAVPFVQANSPSETAATGSEGVPAGPTRTGVSGRVHGVTESLAQIRSRPTPPKSTTSRESGPRRTVSGEANPSPPASPSGPAVGPDLRPASTGAAGPNSPQTLGDEIIGPNVNDGAVGLVPPEAMGAVGPTQFLFADNVQLQAFNKTSPHTRLFNIDEPTFWGSTATGGVSNPHVRYDRTSGRWFITEIDSGTSNADNHILLAVSSSADLSTATWTKFAIPTTDATHDSKCYANDDTPGIDQNGIYIGANMFGSSPTACGNVIYQHSNLYVVQKSSALTSSLSFTSFYNVVAGGDGETIQGVDSVDALTTGFAVAVNESTRQHLTIWQILNPGKTTPMLSAATDVAIGVEHGVLHGVLSHNNAVSVDKTRAMDDLDDRLFSAVIRAGHLWTAHHLAVDNMGNSNPNPGVPDREAVRWYDVTVSGLTLNQSGTVFDTTRPHLNYWMGTVMVSGQGHVAMGMNRANSVTNVQAGAVGRLAGDPVGTMGGFSLFQASTSDAYDDKLINMSGSFNRWGEYSYTSLDPCDDMTMWTAQEYVANAGFGSTPIGWGVAAEKLQAPPPATPSSANPGSVDPGQSSVDVVVTGTTSNGSGFYDTPATLTDPCRTHVTAAVTGGVTVNSVTFTDPTHVTVNVSTVGATPGAQTVTITNPDGQSAGAAILTINSATSTPSVTSTITNTPTVTSTATVTQTPSVTSTTTDTPTVTQTPTVISTPTVTQTPSVTSTPTETATPTVTSTATNTPTMTSTPTTTSSPTITATTTVTPTGTVTSNPLVGVNVVEPASDVDGAGLAEAFSYRATASGTVTALSVYLAASNRATTVSLGLYTDSPTHHPQTLLTSGSVSSPANGAWNTVVVPAASVTKGTRYWLALLAPQGSGRVNFRAVTTGSASETSQSSRLSALPTQWAKGPATKASPASLAALSQGHSVDVLVGTTSDVGTVTPVPAQTGDDALGSASGSGPGAVDGALPSDSTAVEPVDTPTGGGDFAVLP